MFDTLMTFDHAHDQWNLFRIWFFIPDLHWEGDNILAWVDFILLRINLQYILTPSHLQSKWIITTYRKKQNKTSYVTEKCENILSDFGS